MISLRFLHIAFFSLLGLSFLSQSARAQFINIQIRVEPELTAKVEQELNFGSIVSNSGQQNIGLGDTNMGIFSIKALYTQSIYIELNTPDFLENSDGFIGGQIPISLDLAYNNTGVENASSSKFLSSNSGFVPIYETASEGIPRIIWQDLYLYIFGTLDVGDIPNGVYTGEVQLIVFYD